MFNLLNSHNTIGVLIKESFAFLSIVIPFIKNRFTNNNNNSNSMSINDDNDNENNRLSLIMSAQSIMKKYIIKIHTEISYKYILKYKLK